MTKIKAGTLYTLFFKHCQGIKDHRAANASIPLPDFITTMLGLIMFKFGSLDALEILNRRQRRALKRLFGISKIPSDSRLREVLDEIDPITLLTFFPKLWKYLRQFKLTATLQLPEGKQVIALDGTVYRESKKICCKHCCKYNTKDEKISYRHALLAAVAVCPGKAEVIPLAVMPIEHEDGNDKSTGETTVAKRIMDFLGANYLDEQFIIGGDALYCNGEVIPYIQKYGWEFVLNVKKGSQETMFATIAVSSPTGTQAFTSDGVEQGIRWYEGVALNKAHAEITGTFIELQETKGEKTTTFTWFTNMTVNSTTVKDVAMIGRARWKIENEGFNNVKNNKYGYNLSHNYGHGKKHLSFVTAIIIFISFAFDRIIELTSEPYKALKKLLKKRNVIYEKLRLVISEHLVKTMEEIYLHLIKLQLE